MDRSDVMRAVRSHLSRGEYGQAAALNQLLKYKYGGTFTPTEVKSLNAMMDAMSKIGEQDGRVNEYVVE